MTEVAYDEQGLVPVIVQDDASGEILMLADEDRAIGPRNEALYCALQRRRGRLAATPPP